MTSAELYAPLRCSCGGHARLACSNGCAEPELERRESPFAATTTRAPRGGGDVSNPMPARRTRVRKSELADARDAEIVRRYQAGEGLPEIGLTFGVTGERCRQILVKRGVPRRPSAGHRVAP